MTRIESKFAPLLAGVESESRLFNEGTAGRPQTRHASHKNGAPERVLQSPQQVGSVPLAHNSKSGCSYTGSQHFLSAWRNAAGDNQARLDGLNPVDTSAGSNPAALTLYAVDESRVSLTPVANGNGSAWCPANPEGNGHQEIGECIGELKQILPLLHFSERVFGLRRVFAVVTNVPSPRNRVKAGAALFLSQSSPPAHHSRNATRMGLPMELRPACADAEVIS